MANDNIVPLNMQNFKEALVDPTKLHCLDCGGWPIEDGATFVAVFLVRNGVAELGGICEGCWLRRLHRRGTMINITSGPGYQVDVPGLDLPHPRPPTPPRNPRPLRSPKRG
jgi:hypothetical protein